MNDKTKRKISLSMRGRQNTLGHHHTDKSKKKISDSHRGITHTDKAKIKISNSMKGKQNCLGNQLSITHKKNISTANSGKNHYNWQGGVSFEPYCHKFNEEFKESVREQFGRACFICGIPENGRKLDVHHVNYDKECLCSEVECEFVPLCRSCHMKTNRNRGHWENLILNKLECD